MKNLQTFIKSTFILLVLSLTLTSSGKVNKKRNAKAVQQESVVSYFSDVLNEKQVAFTESEEFGIEAIQEKTQLVWDAWKTANANHSEQKLISIESLKNGKSGSWNLPEELEPNAIMPYYWGSKGTKPAAGYPLFLYMHGSGDKYGEWNTGLNICNGFNDAPSLYFIPQIPNTGSYYRWYQKAKQYAWEKLLRLAFVSGNVDANRVYFFGISEGGYGSQRLASYYADYLAGAGPMAGGEPLKNAPAENCRHIAFSLLTGAEDNMFHRNTLTQYTKDEFKRLQTIYPKDFTHRIELIPNAGHGIDYTRTTPWLKQYTRNPHPKSFNWENYEMDGWYRKGFYNLAVVERSNPNQAFRTYYQVDIEDNQVDIKVELLTYKTTEIDPTWQVHMKFERTYYNAPKGKFIVYLNSSLVNLEKEVTLNVNGKQAFKGVLKPDLKHLVNSCATFFDPERLYPAAIEVDLQNLGNTSVTQTSENKLNLTVNKNSVGFTLADDELVQIFDVSGKLVFQKYLSVGTHTVVLNHGVYILRVGDKAEKFVIGTASR
ncbi:MAG TPA: T9SS type A sorting domain-containing protein [Bacteroidales bacterium]|nr:T9SS type A sorting domain-containing protein [Bacteroidales bacterium]